MKLNVLDCITDLAGKTARPVRAPAYAIEPKIRGLKPVLSSRLRHGPKIRLVSFESGRIFLLRLLV
jgi:hypothetical protein